MFNAAKKRDIKKLKSLWNSSQVVKENKGEIFHLLMYNESLSKRNITRLALLISQDCALACRYCYANQGTYHYRGKMNEKIAKEAVKKFYDAFEDIKTLQFFGGEPLLNLKVIKEVLEFLISIEKFPTINIESGLGVGESILRSLINLTKKYEKWFNFEMVVSIDGPKPIQNYLRPFKNGKGSYDTVSRNMKILRSVNQPKAIEITYTRLHERKGLDTNKLKVLFKLQFGVENLMVVPVITHDRTLAVDIKETYECERYLNGTLDLRNLPESIKNEIGNIANFIFNIKPNEYYCDAGINSFVVDIMGDVYPCQMIVGREEFKVSNVTKDSREFKMDIVKAKKRYTKYISKLHDEKCSKCILRYACSGCVFEDVYLGFSNTPKIPHEFCDKRVKISRKLLKAKFWEVLT